MPKRRLDEALVQQGLAPTLETAKRMIMAGEVLVDNVPASKSSDVVLESAALRTRKKGSRFASRAGEKLAAAMASFQVSAKDRIALDLGASTGGFTDCLLQDGAQKVYAVDVGTNQLVYRLRTDIRVVSLEKTHAKELNTHLIPESIDALTVDVSFTSLRFVLPFVWPFLAESAWIICLFKPQFECERSHVDKGGIVRNKAVIEHALLTFKEWSTHQGFPLNKPPLPSPLKGRQGNQEYLLLLGKA